MARFKPGQRVRYYVNHINARDMSKPQAYRLSTIVRQCIGSSDYKHKVDGVEYGLGESWQCHEGWLEESSLEDDGITYA